MSWRVARSQQRATEIEEARRREEVDARQRATVHLDIERQAADKSHRLVVHNAGQATAREVNVEFLPRPGERSWEVIGVSLPIPSLASGQKMRLILPLALGDPPGQEATATWQDDLGAHRVQYSLHI